MSKSAVFIAATGQNVGKTTLCLGTIAALRKRFSSVGFIKPVGQQHVRISDDLIVDKDVVLFKRYFDLPSEWKDMSPVIIPPGFTRHYLDGEITLQPLLDQIQSSFQKIHESHSYTIVEGTGHVGVGSIVDLNNAKVAALLGLDMVIIVPGGLGSAFDEVSLNLAMCEKLGVKVRGVILNRVLDEKRDMVKKYFTKALDKYGIPLLGCVPYNEFLSNPTIRDFEALFNTSLITGDEHHYRHFKHTRLVAGSLEKYQQDLVSNELIITPASRTEIIQENIKHHRLYLERGEDFQGGMILTGDQAPSDELIQEIQSMNIPTLYTPICSYDAMKMITSYIAKIRLKDTPKIEQAITLVERHVDFDALATAKVRG